MWLTVLSASFPCAISRQLPAFSLVVQEELSSSLTIIQNFKTMKSTPKDLNIADS
jgi:hypothetical protein